jgi:hypothetical protein
MLLKISEYLLSWGIGNLGIDFGVLNILVAQVVGHILNPPAALQEMDGHRVTRPVHGPPLNAGILDIIHKQLLPYPFLEQALTSGEEICPSVRADSDVGSLYLCHVTPEGLLPSKAIL